MKVKVTILTQNNIPLSTLGDNPEEKVRIAWELFLTGFLQENESAKVLNIEVM